MAIKPAERVNKSECCRRFGWSRYEFDRNAAAGMPVVEAAGHKGAEWRIDPAAVRRWLAKRAAEQAARRRRAAAYHEECRREAERVVAAKWEREQARERARREAERAREERWRREREERERDKRLDRAYAACWRLAYEDYGSPKGAFFPNGLPRFAHEDHPGFMADWPFGRPDWWLPPPGMLEAVTAEPACRPYGYVEPDWRRWVPAYVPGRPWPWRAADDPPSGPADDSADPAAGGPEAATPEAHDHRR